MKGRSPIPARDVVGKYFLENRARLLEIAAFLDRCDRVDDPDVAREDFRYRALLRGIRLLAERSEDRTVTLHVALSDPTSEPVESAEGVGPACGAWPGAEV